MAKGNLSQKKEVKKKKDPNSKSSLKKAGKLPKKK